MVTLVRLSQDEFLVCSPQLGVYEIKPLEEAREVLKSCEVTVEEIDLALAEFQKNDHDQAHFGVDRRFIYSNRKEQIV